MGDIEKLQSTYNADIERSQKMYGDESKPTTGKKPSFEIRKEHFAKDLADLTFNPKLNKTFKLNKRYRNLQLGTRLTIAALVSSLGIGIGASVINSHKEPEKFQDEYSVELLDRDTVLKNAEEELLKIVFSNNVENINNAKVDYIFNDADGNTTLRIILDDKVHFSYTNDIMSRFNNDKDISNLMIQMININQYENSSQNKLEKLNDTLENLSNNTYVLNENRIVVNEREDLEKD